MHQFKKSSAVLVAMTLLAFTLPLKAELVGYWSFDGDLKDSSLTKNDAVDKTDKVAYTDDVPSGIKSQKAISLANQAAVRVPNQAGLMDGKAMSISVWFKAAADSPGSWTRILSKSAKVGQDSVGVEIQRVNQTAGLQLRVDTPEQFNRGILLGEQLNNQWHHMVITIDGDVMMIYLDGKASKHGLRITKTLANPADLVIGSASVESQRFFTGMIDDLAVWDSVLTDQQVNALKDGSKTPLDIK